MAKAFEPRFVTPEEYLAFDHASEEKYEYINGRILLVPAARLEHARISVNLTVAVANRLRGGPCNAFAGNMRTKVARKDSYFYPDVEILCEPPHVQDLHGDSLINPRAAFEVLSMSTERFDRGEKREHYQQIDTLETYVLLAQHRMWAEVYTRAGGWEAEVIEGPDAVLPVDSVGISIPFAEIYEGVDLERAAARRRSKKRLELR